MVQLRRSNKSLRKNRKQQKKQQGKKQQQQKSRRQRNSKRQQQQQRSRRQRNSKRQQRRQQGGDDDDDKHIIKVLRKAVNDKREYKFKLRNNSRPFVTGKVENLLVAGEGPVKVQYSQVIVRPAGDRFQTGSLNIEVRNIVEVTPTFDGCNSYDSCLEASISRASKLADLGELEKAKQSFLSDIKKYPSLKTIHEHPRTHELVRAADSKIDLMTKIEGFRSTYVVD